MIKSIIDETLTRAAVPWGLVFSAAGFCLQMSVIVIATHLLCISLPVAHIFVDFLDRECNMS